MAQATRTLSPKRVLEKLRQHRACVLTLAHQSAQRPVRAKLRAQGVKLNDVSYRDLRIQAEAHFDAHRAELIAEAEHAIATWPGFARCPVLIEWAGSGSWLRSFSFSVRKHHAGGPAQANHDKGENGEAVVMAKLNILPLACALT